MFSILSDVVSGVCSAYANRAHAQQEAVEAYEEQFVPALRYLKFIRQARKRLRLEGIHATTVRVDEYVWFEIEGYMSSLALYVPFFAHPKVFDMDLELVLLTSDTGRTTAIEVVAVDDT